MIDAKKDFRYRLGDLEVEAYQLTPATELREQDWPPWLNKQRLLDETDCVFRKDGRLTLALPTGHMTIPALAWIVRFTDGGLGIVDALDFEDYEKVVPIPPKVDTPPADGMLDESHLAEMYPQHIKEGKTVDDYRRKPDAPKLESVKGVDQIPSAHDSIDLRSEMMQAIRLLQDEKTEDALDYLIHSMTKRTKWCSCPPGICSGADEAGCRISSPLVKA